LHPAQPEEVLTTFPASDELTPVRPRESLAVPANGAANDGQNNVVLAVDDNPDIIVLINAAFKNTPYKVVGLTDPLQLMGLIQEVRPCAITLDVMMPTLNGWQILHRLKDDPATSAIPVVMLTVLTEPTTGYVLGADEYVIKPFKPEVLVSTLDRLMACRQSSSQAARPGG
jgi:CheY-like chemotaxis protein